MPKLGSVDTRGFFKLDLSGLLASDGAVVDPFDENVVDIDIVLPLAPLIDEYGLPLALVTATPVVRREKCYPND